MVMVHLVKGEVYKKRDVPENLIIYSFNIMGNSVVLRLYWSLFV